MSTDDILTERLHRAEQDERRTATMSEPPINIDQFNRGYAAGYRDGQAALAPLRAVVEAAKAFMLKWPAVAKASFAAVQIATIHGVPYTGPNIGAELKALADTLAVLPADPSAPTPEQD